MTVALCLLVSCLAAPEPVFWSMDDADHGWRPRGATISLELADGGVTPESPHSLRFHGELADGWNYLMSPQRPMLGGQPYAVSAWLRVDSLGATTPAPFLKCEWLTAEGASLGRGSTAVYDLKRLGEWQELTGEFIAPEGTAICWLAVEKGTSSTCAIDARLDQVRITPIDQLARIRQYQLDPVPEPLAALRGVHPRLYLDPAGAERLRQAVTGTHEALWQEVKEQADRRVRSGPPAYVLHDRYSGDEQLWQREVGNAMPYLAMAWLITGDRQYLAAAEAWAVASCEYQTWGLGRIDGLDLAAGHQLFGLALIYDWCHADLSPEVKQTMLTTFDTRARAMYEAAATGTIWWQRSYLQNHLWVNVCGLAAVGLAAWDELDDATGFIGLPLEKFEQTMAALGHDGASHEGVGYWSYGVEYLLKFMELARGLLGKDLYTATEWFRHTAAYRLYLGLPQAAWQRGSTITDLADSPRHDWYGPDFLLRRLAAEYRDPVAQQLAAELDEAGLDNASAKWLNLIWYDPTLPGAPPTALPTLRHFDDMDIVSARTDWSGDEALLVFKCGPFIGHEAVRAFSYDPGGGHVHPDANHFLLFAGGEWLIRDDGYRAKETGQHNTLLVDGLGQLGEGQMWFNGGVVLRQTDWPRIVSVVAGDQLDQMVGEAAVGYVPEAGLERFHRHLLFVKPDLLLVIDDIVCDRARQLELRFHPEGPGQMAGPMVFGYQGTRARLRVEALTPEGVGMVAEEVASRGRDGGQGTPMYAVRLTREAAAWRNVTALSWTTAGEPVRVRAQPTASGYTFEVSDGRQVAFDWEQGATLR